MKSLIVRGSNFKSSITFLAKPLLLILAVSALTIFFIYARMAGHSSFIYILFLALIILVFLSKRFFTIHSRVIKILLFSALVYISINYGIFFSRAITTQLIGFFGALLFPILFFYPKVMTYLILFVLFFIPSSFFGMTEYSQVMIFLTGIYMRGDDKIGISYLSLFLWLTAISIMFQTMTRKQDDSNISCNLYKYFWLFNGLFLIYIFWGIILGIDLKAILSNKGVINITNMAVFIFIMHRMFKTENDFEQLKKFFLISMLVKGGWFVFRFIFLGGDPRGYIDPSDLTKIRTSVFEIGDIFIQCIALFFALWMLWNRKDRILSAKEPLFYWVIAAVGLFNVLLSYRRTAWGGLFLALSWLMLNLRREKRIAMGAFAILVVLIVGSISAERFEIGEEGFLKRMSPDIITKEGDIGWKSSRFIELDMAWETIKDNLLFGVGPWGKYKLTHKWPVTTEITHSAIFHMLLKMGITGFLVFFLIFAAFVRFWLTHRKELPLHIRGFAEASFAGFLFFMPNILLGTPIHEFKVMLLTGFAMSVPYITYHIYKAENSR